MRVLVAGGTGALGRHLIEVLRARGDSPVALARTPRDDIEVVVANLRDYDATRAAVDATKPDAIVNLASVSSRDDFEIRATCVGGTVSLLSAIPPGTRVVQVGCAEQYGRSVAPLTEDAPLEPETSLGRAKAEAEAFALKQPNVVAARVFCLAGRGDSRSMLGSVAAQIARAEAGSGPSEIKVSDVSGSLDIVDYGDAARALALLVDHGERGTAYNVCTGVATSLRDPVRMLVELSRVPLDLVFEDQPDPTVTVGNPSRLRGLGWAPEAPLPQTLTTLLEAHRAAVQRA